MKATKTAIFKITEKWQDISQKFCDFQGFPYGSSLKIVYRNNSKYPGRVQRSSTRYDRMAFRKNTTGQADDQLTIRRLIDDHLLPFVDIDLGELRADIVAFDPDGERLEANLSVKSWRGLPGQMTREMVDAENAFDEKIDGIAKEVKASLNFLTDAKRDHEKTIPRAVLRELIRRYGLPSVKMALAEEAALRP